VQHLQSRVQHLLSRVQYLFAEIQECSVHSGPKLSDEEDCGPDDDDDDADNLVNDDGDGYEKLLCPYEECDGTPKTSFRTWKDLVRHYTIPYFSPSVIYRIWRGLTNLIRRRSMSRNLWVLWHRHILSTQICDALRQL
jgi:hypothetical protein